jgi:hypothetical protein
VISSDDEEDGGSLRRRDESLLARKAKAAIGARGHGIDGGDVGARSELGGGDRRDRIARREACEPLCVRRTADASDHQRHTEEVRARREEHARVVERLTEALVRECGRHEIEAASSDVTPERQAERPTAR